MTRLSGLERSGRAPAFPLTLEAAAPGWTVAEAFPSVTFDDPTSFGEAPGTGHIFVTEREGRVYAFRNDPGASSKLLSLDLSNRTQGEEDCGLLSLTFHPDFGKAGSPNRSYVYVHYAYSPSPIVGRVPARTTRTSSRLSRFSVNLDTLVIDPASELVLIDQADESTWHQGGAAFFGPEDGFLYLSVGDEGLPYCSLRNCQRIDR
ncbi:MAG TPA: PQQ-dependent sugar dehydrogenase, partial [Polyangiaceae bacterium]|nr:PQQ-dependent sugar dehydrogenase [Polyangiaceae bacterium]